MTGHDLRARTLVARDDPRIHRALRKIPATQRTTSPEAAYYQAALIVAEHDTRDETARRDNPICYRIGYTIGILLMLTAAATLVYGIVRLLG